MTSKRTHLNASLRTLKHTREARRQGIILAVLYGYGLKNLNVQVDSKAFSAIFNQAGYTSLITLIVSDGGQDKDHTVLIRDMQLHPLKNTVQHVDFYQPRLDQAITANVPLSFVGEAPAVKDLGGVLVRTLDEVKLEALPVDLPHNIAVDISSMDNFAKSIYIRDLVLPPRVKLHHEPEEVVALVQPPRTEEELEALEEEVKEDVTAVEGVQEPTEEAKSGEEAAETGKTATADKEAPAK